MSGSLHTAFLSDLLPWVGMRVKPNYMIPKITVRPGRRAASGFSDLQAWLYFNWRIPEPRFSVVCPQCG